MSDQADGRVADGGQAVQNRLNQAAEAQDAVVQFARDHPISAVLIAVGVGYVLGKIT